jgi:hypothetical protein
LLGVHSVLVVLFIVIALIACLHLYVWCSVSNIVVVFFIVFSIVIILVHVLCDRLEKIRQE